MKPLLSKVHPYAHHQPLGRISKKKKRVPYTETITHDKVNPKEPFVLENKKCNVSDGRVIYEKARSRRERTRVILRGDAETALPLGRSGPRGPHRTSDLYMPRHDDGEPEEREEEYALKAKLRLVNIRHSFKVQKRVNGCSDNDMTSFTPHMDKSHKKRNISKIKQRLNEKLNARRRNTSQGIRVPMIAQNIPISNTAQSHPRPVVYDSSHRDSLHVQAKRRRFSTESNKIKPSGPEIIDLTNKIKPSGPEIIDLTYDSS